MKKFRSIGFEIRIYDNRIEITRHRLLFGNEVTIPFSSLASVDLSTLNVLTIKTIDGKKYRFSYGLRVGKANRVRNAIIERL